MKRVIYKKTGDVDKKTKSFPAILFRSRERNKNLLIGNAPVEVSDREYSVLKAGKHGKHIVAVTANTTLSKPMEHDINGPEIKTVKVEKKSPKKKTFFRRKK